MLSQGASLADAVGLDCDHSFFAEIALLAFLPCCFLLRMLTGIIQVAWLYLVPQGNLPNPVNSVFFL